MAPIHHGWQRPCEGLKYGKTTKGRVEGVGGKVANFMNAIAYDKGVIMAKQYHGHLDGMKFITLI